MRVRLKHLLAWCGPGIPVAALGVPLVIYLPPHYAGTLGLPLTTVGLIFAIVRMVDIPFDPLLGALMDRTRSRIGQFRPWLLGGALLLSLGTWLMFMAEPGVGAIRTAVALFILYLGYSSIQLAQVSWGAWLSADYGERARIFGFWTASNVLGNLSVLFIPPLLLVLLPGSTATQGIHAIGWFILALIPITIAIAVSTVPEGEAPAPTHGFSARAALAVLSDGRMKRLLLADLLLSILPGITGALFLFYFTRARGYPLETASQILLCYFVAGLVAAPLWIKLAQRKGKHRAGLLAALWLGIAPLSLLLIAPGNPLADAIAIAIGGLPYAAPPFLLRAMLADLNDAQQLDARESGTPAGETTGLSFALLTATQKLGYAIPVGLTYPLLSLIGFDPLPDAANSPQTLANLQLLFLAPPVILGLAAAALLARWPISADRHAEIRARLTNG
ncbi:MFS transporter [Sandaracinobacter neustonicus]|uniref:MFS transporter n=1 Tax=Sandaracinobacter neustonicus TaxID=1715348 RepID=UPI0015E3A45F|nr:MFS transporter [Sandaracinobacter neustonicus]